MERTVNRELLQSWINKNSIHELAKISGLSVYLILKVKSGTKPYVPVKDSSQAKLASALGVQVDELFPPVNKTA